MMELRGASPRRMLVAFCLCAFHAFAQETAPFLLRDPSVSKSQVAFSYAGYLWTASRDGSDVKQLTRAGHESKPFFSPDGSEIAFTGEYDGWHGIYVVPAKGGEPRRITSHPADLNAVGWTPDGTRVVFASRRSSFTEAEDENSQLFTVPPTGGFATAVPLTRAASGSFSKDESHIAYVPSVQWDFGMNAWKHYRGGQTKPIWIARLADSSIEAKIPRDNSNDFNPMWVGNTVYFLSDRDGPVTLFAYDTKTKKVRRLIENHGFDIQSASISDGTIIYDQFGSLHLYDLAPERDQVLDIRPKGDFPEVLPHTAKLDVKHVRSANISPDGKEAVLGARGEVLTVSLQNGEVRNLTQTADVSEIDPSWSPDNRSVAYFSDASGEYALHIRDVENANPVEQVDLGKAPAFYYAPTWSPDAKKIAYSDNRLGYWYVDRATKKPVHFDTDLFSGPQHSLQLAWSPDSRWIAYVKQLTSHMHAVFAYSLENNQTYQLTDGESDALYPAFDRTGRYLYFTASTDAAFSNGWVDMSSVHWTPTRNVYAIVLKKDDSSPAVPMSDVVEKLGSRPNSQDVSPDVAIGTKDIQSRIVRLPIRTGIYTNLFAGGSGILYLLEAENKPADAYVRPTDQPATLLEVDLAKKEPRVIVETVKSLRISADAEHVLYKTQDRWFVMTLPKPAEAVSPARELNLAEAKISVDPKREWKHMFDQAWRDQRDFFYDPGLHGLDLQATRKKYEPFLENVSTREDLNYLFRDMLGNITVGHMYIAGGDVPEIVPNEVGLLGADYSIVNNRYRIDRIYHGDPWSPDLRAPLDELGAHVQEGEYLLAVNGKEILASEDIYSYFGRTANKRTELTVSANADGSNARKVIVEPTNDEAPLRSYVWVQKNKALVDKLTGNRVAYVYLSNTAADGLKTFLRSYFAQVGKEAVIIDERYNHGGDLADSMVDALRRPLLGYWHTRDGQDMTEPIESIFGPKVMLANELSGSGGDGLAWMFHESGTGTLIGKRTWGGLVAGSMAPDDLLDGGTVHSLDLAFYTTHGIWGIENHGVSPDIEVEDDPQKARQGGDPQLEMACTVVLERLKKAAKPSTPQHPPYPNYHRNGDR
jgi:tricorn protease